MSHESNERRESNEGERERERGGGGELDGGKARHYSDIIEILVNPFPNDKFPTVPN